MKRFFTSSKGIALFAITLVLIGAFIAALVPSLSALGAVLTVIGITIFLVWAFVTGNIF